jgi:hypothetical protein
MAAKHARASQPGAKDFQVRLTPDGFEMLQRGKLHATLR